ncbi:nuclease [Desulfuromonas sp. DDH964]|uniref:thermonuclease family protein n=1 Tax=Desulfuromonas sp. DDH964 TaxID=1823759 RepID=UPI00078DB741|nr:thermonuclease family protein [Desulfuromonas sp. DDH964]AMV70741.1 nuclease [Desulfuromonas sp. DDH964]
MRLLAILLLFLSTSPVFALSFSGKVVKVSDGDTIQVMHDGHAEKIRLAGIDCPEKKQAFGQAAKRFTLDLAAQKVVTVKIETTDRYGRTVGEVILPGGKSLNRELVRAGYAWWYQKYSSDTTLGLLESEARAAHRGLWAVPDPVPPWEWRHGVKNVSSPGEPAQSFPGKARECGQKQYCKEMISCEEAMFFLRDCGLFNLDRDSDGIPCESMCR